MLFRFIVLKLLLVLIVPSVVFGQEGTLEWGEITSPALEGNLLGDDATRSFAVYLPPNYETSQNRYPAFYMLHGAGQQNAGTFTGMKFTIDSMIQDGEIEEMIAVFVDGSNRLGGSWYFSSVTLGDYETYITRDLVNYVDTHYRTIPHRNSRGITGYSMGGHGSMHLALKFPDVFGAVVAQAGAYDFDSMGRSQWLTEPNMRGWYAAALPAPNNPPNYYNVPYVVATSQIIEDLWEKVVELDVMHDVDRYSNQPVRLNGIKIVHGLYDDGVPMTQARGLDEKLTDQGIDHIYVEHDGGHVFIAEESLSFLGESLSFLDMNDSGETYGSIHFDGIPLCALVLANGQYMFTCDDSLGLYDLTVPLDENGEITLYGFCSGFSPFKTVLTPEQALDYEIQMSRAPDDSRQIEIALQTEQGIINPDYVRINGTVTYEGTPLCTMVLANGQNMFSCDADLGMFDLEVPLDENGEITLYCFCSGFAPYMDVFIP